jgi:hypothetical protein
VYGKIIEYKSRPHAYTHKCYLLDGPASVSLAEM